MGKIGMDVSIPHAHHQSHALTACFDFAVHRVCWSENRSLETWRAYNYPHVAAVYWSLYRLARHFSPPLARRASRNRRRAPHHATET